MHHHRPRAPLPCLAPGSLVSGIAGLAATLALAGCRQGPDYHEPDLGRLTDAAWRAEPSGPLASQAEGSTSDDAWWRSFGDPELEALVERLAASNLELAASRERIVEARARRGQIRADRLPRVDLDAEYKRVGSGDDALAFAAPPPGETSDFFAAGPLVDWELDLWSRVGRLVESADAEVEAAWFDHQAAFVSLSAELALAWVDVRILGRRLEAARAATALQEQTLELARSKLSAGSGTELDVAQAERELASTRARMPELERARAAAENAIAVLLGERPGAGLVEAGELPRPPEVIGLGLPSQLVARRADVRAAERRYAAAVAGIGAADAERYPSLTLSGTFRLQSDTVGGLFDDSLVYGFGPDLRFPLFEGGRIDSKVRARESAAEQARIGLELSLLRAIEEVETAAAGVVESRNRLAELERARQAALRAEDLAEQRYRSGSRSLLELLDVQRALVAVDDEYLLAEQETLAESIRLFRALGGGWLAPSDDGAPDAIADEDPRSPARDHDERPEDTR